MDINEVEKIVRRKKIGLRASALNVYFSLASEKQKKCNAKRVIARLAFSEKQLKRDDEVPNKRMLRELEKIVSNSERKMY